MNKPIEFNIQMFAGGGSSAWYYNIMLNCNYTGGTDTSNYLDYWTNHLQFDFNRQGYCVAFWSTNSDGTGDCFAPYTYYGEFYTKYGQTSHNIILYAQWVPYIETTESIVDNRYFKDLADIFRTIEHTKTQYSPRELIEKVRGSLLHTINDNITSTGAISCNNMIYYGNKDKLYKSRFYTSLLSNYGKLTSATSASNYNLYQVFISTVRAMASSNSSSALSSINSFNSDVEFSPYSANCVSYEVGTSLYVTPSYINSSTGEFSVTLSNLSNVGITVSNLHKFCLVIITEPDDIGEKVNVYTNNYYEYTTSGSNITVSITCPELIGSIDGKLNNSYMYIMYN